MMPQTAEIVKIAIVGARHNSEKVINTLHSMGSLEIQEVKDDRLQRESPHDSFGEISEQLLKLQLIEGNLPPQKESIPQKVLPLRVLLKKAVNLDIDHDILEINKRKKEILERREQIETSLLLLKDLTVFHTDLSTLENPLTDVFVVKAKKTAIEQIDGKISKHTKAYSKIEKPLEKKGKITLYAIDKRKAPQIAKIFDESNVEYFTQKEIFQFKGKPKKLLEERVNEMKAMDLEEKNLEKELQKLSEKHFSIVSAYREMLEIEAERAQLPKNFRRTENLFLINAWVQKENLERIKTELEKKLKGKIHLEQQETAEEPPVVLKNPKVIQPFESLVDFFALPGKGEPDPTIFLALGFPILFGMMLGDAGYGLGALLLGSLIAKKTTGIMQSLGKVWAYASIPTIIFGVIYDEYLGFAHHELIGFQLYHPPLERLHELNAILLLSIFAGILHMAIGFLIGFFANWNHHRSHAWAKLGWFGLTVSGPALVAILVFETLSSAFLWPSSLIALLGLIAIVKAEGIFGLTEIPGLAGNILSYARIMAVGMSSVALALIINELFTFEDLSLSLIITFPIFLLLHFGNLVLGIFESSIQGIRLNYAEFFSKFYEGGGRAFKPFTYTRTNTIE
ncbi:MAG: V-type ATPase 116kDa subunit family protein [Candidatus Altiarchaeota archaeon]